MERNVCRRFLTVNGLAFAALFAGASLAQTPDTGAQGQSQSQTSAPAHAKKSKAAASAAGAKSAETDAKSKGSYGLGVSLGARLHELGVPNDSISIEAINRGIRDSLSGKVQMDKEQMESINSLITAGRASIGEQNHAAAKKFLAENAKNKDVVTTASGLQYKVVTAGTGDSPKPTDLVTVNYRGKLLDGTEFDSSYKRGQPASFPANGVIPGWQEALGLMKPGAKWQLFIPPNLGYDMNSRPPIPPGSLLVFDVELVSFKAPPPPAQQPGAPSQQPPQQQQQK